MILNKEALDLIRKYLGDLGIKDSSFLDTSLLTGSEYMTLIVNGLNKKIKTSILKTIFSGSGATTTGGILIVETYSDLSSLESKGFGNLVYVKEDDLYYSYSSTDSWTRVLKLYVGTEEPIDKTVTWIDTNDTAFLEGDYDDNIILIKAAIKDLLDNISILLELRTNGVVAGTSTTSARTDMMSAADPIDPSTGELGSTEEYPEYADALEPTVNHISIKLDTLANLKAHYTNFINGELLWATDISKLFMYYGGTLNVISGSSSSSSGTITSEQLDLLSTIGFINSLGNKFRVKIDKYGNLVIYSVEVDNVRSIPTNETDVYINKLYINSVYCGNSNDAHSYLPCSHNFIELANVTTLDIQLNGLYLMYATTSNTWEKLPLWGTIKANSTFLIRGAQCSVLDANTTILKVNTFDMAWYDSNGELIKFNYTGENTELHIKFYLTWGTLSGDIIECYNLSNELDLLPGSNPYSYYITNKAVLKGYIDLAGFGALADGWETRAYNPNDSSVTGIKEGSLFVRYYNLDPVTLGNPSGISARDESKYWCHINLNASITPNLLKYTPKASFENKNIFFNKNLFDDFKPNIVNITFGILATDSGNGATRCFNWISNGYYDEYLYYKKNDSSIWTIVESYKDSNISTGPLCVQLFPSIYTRQRWETTDGKSVTTHKVIISGLTSGDYTYKIVRDLTYSSSELFFTIKSSPTTFKFLLVSDLQGFKWEEYEVWRKASEFISTNENFDFSINTGDMTQNGNRVNEWIDYYNARKSMQSKEEMVTIGNNDLCGVTSYILGDGNDSSKINPINITYYYTFEIDVNNPPIFTLNNKSVYIPSLYSYNYGNYHFICLNSEITSTTETNVFGVILATTYPLIENWLRLDLQLFKGVSNEPSNCKNCIIYCHEMPFTIVTNATVSNYSSSGYSSSSGRETTGALLNRNNSEKYKFSRLFKTWGIRLVIGGHKHTFSLSYPIYDAPEDYATAKNLMGTVSSVASMKPYIQLLNGETITKDTNLYLHREENVSEITAPVYLMCLTTGYKHTSNKELPSETIPWLRYYYPCTNSKPDLSGTDSVNTALRYPFYVIYDLSETSIIINAYYLDYIFKAGKFDINNLVTTLPERKLVNLVNSNTPEYTINL